MRAEVWAVLAAICWGVGTLVERRGVKIGGLTPVMGTAIRTSFSFLLLLVASFPFWGQMKTAGAKPIFLIAIGGGVIAGGLGLVLFYAGLKAGHLSTVLCIAFCLTPVIGALLGYFLLREKLSLVQVIGIILCVTGAALVTYFRQT